MQIHRWMVGDHIVFETMKYLGIISKMTENGKHNSNLYQFSQVIGLDEDISFDILMELRKMGYVDLFMGGEFMMTSSAKSVLAGVKPVSTSSLSIQTGPVFQGDVSNSQIMTSSPGATQSIQQTDISAVLEWIRNLELKIDQIQFNQDEDLDEIKSDIQTIKSQAIKRTPNGIIIKESLNSIRKILEKAGGAIVASILASMLV